MQEASERTPTTCHYSTHPFFSMSCCALKEVRVLYRDEQGYTQVVRVGDIQGVPEFIQAGASLGHLWLEGQVCVGDPLVNARRAHGKRAIR